MDEFLTEDTRSLPRVNPHYVYIMASETRPNHYKVGISKDCEKRLKSMKTADPSMFLWKKYEVDDEKTARAVEKIAHEMLARRYKKTREWFVCDHNTFITMFVDAAIEDVLGEDHR